MFLRRQACCWCSLTWAAGSLLQFWLMKLAYAIYKQTHPHIPTGWYESLSPSCRWAERTIADVNILTKLSKPWPAFTASHAQKYCIKHQGLPLCSTNSPKHVYCYLRVSTTSDNKTMSLVLTTVHVERIKHLLPLALKTKEIPSDSPPNLAHHPLNCMLFKPYFLVCGVVWANNIPIGHCVYPTRCFFCIQHPLWKLGVYISHFVTECLTQLLKSSLKTQCQVPVSSPCLSQRPNSSTQRICWILSEQSPPHRPNESSLPAL